MCTKPLTFDRPPVVSRRGLTLVELLVVVTILMILLGVVLPLATPSLKGRKLREAARQVNTAFASAKSKAEGLGRPAGVIITPDPNESSRSYSLAFAKVAGIFTGSTEGSVVSIDTSINHVMTFGVYNPMTGSYDNDATSKTQLERLLGITANSVQTQGTFLIRFRYQGPWQVCFWRKNNSGGTFYIADPAIGSEEAFKDVTNGNGISTMEKVPYQIQIPPKRSAAAAITLPTGTYIDLDHSIRGTITIDSNPIAFMFDGRGRPDRIHQGTSAARFENDLALLIVDADIDHDDILKPEAGSYWIIVNQETGQVKTAENVGPTFPAVDVNGDNVTDELDNIITAANQAAAGTKAGGR